MDDRYVSWVDRRAPKSYKRGSEVYRFDLQKLDQLGIPFDPTAAEI